jgi:hypothetical protein
MVRRANPTTRHTLAASSWYGRSVAARSIQPGVRLCCLIAGYCRETRRARR